MRVAPAAIAPFGRFDLVFAHVGLDRLEILLVGQARGLVNLLGFWSDGGRLFRFPNRRAP